MRLVVIALVLAIASVAGASELVCKGERIEKGSSTWGYARSSGSDWRIEKGSSTVGWARKANGDWRIETSGGSTIGWLRGGRIESAGGSTRAQASEARSFASSCPDEVAVALWVLQREGKL